MDDRQHIKSDAGKLKLSLCPTSIIKAIARVRMYGISKYGQSAIDNWQKVSAKDYTESAYRHFLEFVKDPYALDESGLPHLFHLAVNVSFLIEELYSEMDSYGNFGIRPPAPLGDIDDDF